MTILIAEDMAFQRDYLRAIITEHFADAGPVIEAADGNSALSWLAHRPGWRCWTSSCRGFRA
jgi:hypothetical protein